MRSHRGRGCLIALWALATMMVPACANSSSSGPSRARAGTILYYGDCGSSATPRLALCAINPDGSDLHQRQVASDASSMGQPSPDGTKAATSFSSEVGLDDSTLAVSNLDGSAGRRIWHFLGVPTSAPAWNPSRSELALGVTTSTSIVVPERPTPPGLWIVNATGSAPHRLEAITGGALAIAWSPNGQQLAYEAQSGSSLQATALNVVSLHGGPPRRIATIDQNSLPASSQLQWSPDGGTLLVTTTHGSDEAGPSTVETVSVTNKQARVLYPNNPTVAYEGALYSPNGKSIVVEKDSGLIAAGTPPTTTQGGPHPHYINAQLIVSSPDGSHQTVITPTNLHAIRPLVWLPTR